MLGRRVLAGKLWRWLARALARLDSPLAIRLVEAMAGGQGGSLGHGVKGSPAGL
jgi:hypothetical protein